MSGVLGVLLGDNAAAGGSFDAATELWASAVVAAGGTVSGTQKGYVDTLIKGLKADSLFTTIDRLWLLASENAFQAGIDIINLGTFSAVTNQTFSASHGYTGSGSGSFINSGVTPSSFSGNLAQNSMSIGVYILTSRTADANVTQIGASDSGSNDTLMQINAFGNNNIMAITAGGSIVLAGANSQGFWTGSRTSATALAFYKNGSSISTANVASTGLPTVPIYITAQRYGGSLLQSSTDQIAAAHIGGGLNSTQAGNLSTRLNAYMTSLGVNVF